MKYSKIIKDNFQNKFAYIFTILFSCVFFILLCLGSVELHLITTWFSGGTSVNDATYNVTYYANMPEGVFSAVEFKIYGATFFYEVRDNEFGTPLDYEFIGWNTSSDGSGISYQKGSIILLETNISLYAQWKSLSDDNFGNDESVDDENIELPGEDDENLDSDISNDENVGDNIGSTDNNNSLDEDVNNVPSDGNINNNDPDVEINNGSSSDGSGSSSNSGNGSSSSNGGSAGNGNNSNASTPSNGNNSSSNDSNNNKIEKPNNSSDNSLSNDKELLKKYKFRFFNKNVEFTTTTCEILEDGMCMFVLPNDNPSIKGYTFVGWSESALCDKDIIRESIQVNSSKDYFACYEITKDKVKENKSIIYLIVSIWIIASISIYFIIKKFKNRI